MASLMFVEDQERPDLRTFAKLTQADMKGYAFGKFMPVITTTEKGGSIWVAPTTLTNAAGVTGRANGSALSATALATLQVDYTTARIEGRAAIYENEMHGFADINAACQAGATVAGRKVLNSIETAAIGTVFTSVRTTAATTMADHEVVKTIQKAAIAIRAYGKACLGLSDTAFLKLCDIPEIRRRLEAFSKTSGDVGYMALNDEKVRASISTLLYVNEIAVYDSAVVGTDNDGYVAVVGIRPDAIGKTGDAVRTIAKTDAMFGAMMVYIPQDAAAEEPFVVSQSSDKTDKVNYFDAEGFVVAKNFTAATAAEGGTSLTENGGAVVLAFAGEYTEYRA